MFLLSCCDGRTDGRAAKEVSFSKGDALASVSDGGTVSIASCRRCVLNKATPFLLRRKSNIIIIIIIIVIIIIAI